jgi:hypothetical protein
VSLLSLMGWLTPWLTTCASDAPDAGPPLIRP